MKNQTLVFKKGVGDKVMHMEMKCGDSYPLPKETIIKLMEKCGWKLWKVKG